MLNTYSLVIPTYNRPRQLEKLLAYLQCEKANFPILILDSSGTESRLLNQGLITRFDLNIQYIEYPNDIQPFDKFYDGVRRVTTPYCQLCADDDLILVSEINKCIEHLKAHPELKAAHGYYFSFYECHVQGGMDLTQILYFTPSYNHDEPLVRLRDLFRNYQALTYAVYDATTLAKILDIIRNVDKILARELLGSALAVIYGKVARLPFFTHGRSMNASEPYKYWHPLEWLTRTPAGLMSEYQQYKKILVEALLENKENSYSDTDVDKIIDLIHMFYLVRHAPEASFDYIIEKSLEKKTIDDMWSAFEIQYPLTQVKYLSEINRAAFSFRKSPVFKVIKRLSRLIWKPKPLKQALAQVDTYKSSIRSYRVHENFKQVPQLGVAFDNMQIEAVMASLDHYRTIEEIKACQI